MPALSPALSTYTSRTPYLTVAEYQSAPTGVDWGNLNDGTPQQNVDELAQTIGRASSWIDAECRKILAATLDTQSGVYRVGADGCIRVPLDFTPILEVTAVQVGSSPSALVALSDLSGVWIGRKVVTIPLAGVPVTSGQVFAVVQYVNGYANTAIETAATAGSSSITVASALGVMAGQTLTVYDSGSSEQVTVTAVTGDVLTLAAPTGYAHAQGVAVSALPPAVKQACILLTSALIKTRGIDEFEMPSIAGQPAKVQESDPSGSDDVAIAMELLATYRRAA